MKALPFSQNYITHPLSRTCELFCGRMYIHIYICMCTSAVFYWSSSEVAQHKGGQSKLRKRSKRKLQLEHQLLAARHHAFPLGLSQKNELRASSLHFLLVLAFEHLAASPSLNECCIALAFTLNIDFTDFIYAYVCVRILQNTCVRVSALVHIVAIEVYLFTFFFCTL